MSSTMTPYVLAVPELKYYLTWQIAEMQWDQIDPNDFLAEEVIFPETVNQQPATVGEPLAVSSNHGQDRR